MPLKAENRKKQPQSMAEEAEVVRRVRQGDTDRFRFLVERYQGRVYGLARRLLGDHHDAEDACQETFVRAFNGLSGFDTRYPFVNWLLTITVNLSRRTIKRRARKRMQALPAQDPGEPEAPKPHDVQENLKVLQEAVSAALDQLPKRRRKAFLLLQQSQRSYAEIADIMDLPIGTIKTDIHRARQAIHKHLSARHLLSS